MPWSLAILLLLTWALADGFPLDQQGQDQLQTTFQLLPELQHHPNHGSSKWKPVVDCGRESPSNSPEDLSSPEEGLTSTESSSTGAAEEGSSSSSSCPVAVALSVSVINVDVSLEGLVSAHVWLTYAWEDQRLAWDPREYGNVTEVTVPADKIWSPDVTLISSYDAGGHPFSRSVSSGYATGASADSSVLVNSCGGATQVEDKVLHFKCEDYFNSSSRSSALWSPFGCALRFGSWSSFSTDLDLVPSDAEVDLGNLNGASSLRVVSSSMVRSEIEYTCCQETYVEVVVNLDLQRSYLVMDSGEIQFNNHHEEVRSEEEEQEQQAGTGEEQEQQYNYEVSLDLNNEMQLELAREENNEILADVESTFMEEEEEEEKYRSF